MQSFAALAMLSGVLVSVCAARAIAIPVAAIEAFGQYRPVGTLMTFDSSQPANAVVIGQTGLTHIGAMDYHDQSLWVVADSGGFRGFYQVDLQTAVPTLISTTDQVTRPGKIFGGTFDSQNRFWVSDFEAATLTAFDPLTGATLATRSTNVGTIVGGLGFAGTDLYALTTDGFGIVNMQTGAISSLGSSKPCSGGAMGLDYDDLAGVFLYTCNTGSAAGPDSRLGTIDRATGAIVVIGDVVPSSTLDAIAVIPEPASGTLVVFGLTAVAVQRRRVL
jgi:hypothetical protein